MLDIYWFKFSLHIALNVKCVSGVIIPYLLNYVRFFDQKKVNARILLAQSSESALFFWKYQKTVQGIA